MADCIRCNTPLPENAAFCGRCGAYQELTPTARSGISRGMLIAVVVASVAVTVAAVLGVMLLHRQTSSAPQAERVTVTATPSADTAWLLAQQTAANEAAVKEGLHSIQIGVQSYCVDNHNQYPDPSLVTSTNLVDSNGQRYVDNWPTNPYTGEPMAQGTQPGNFTYEVTAEGGYQLTGYGQSGPVLTVP